MKKILFSTLLCAGLSFAQMGMSGSSEGIHQKNAQTLGKGGFMISTGESLTLDSWSLMRGGNYTDANGRLHVLNENIFSLSGSLNAAVGVTSFLDFGASLPIYYEWASSDENEKYNEYDPQSYDMEKLGLGDAEIWLKARIAPANRLVGAAITGTVYLPTGEESVGARPRHVWYINENSKGFTHPYTADYVNLQAGLVLSFDFTKVGAPVKLNLDGSYVFNLGDGFDAVTYGAGFNYLPNSILDLFIEWSGEMRISDGDMPFNFTRDLMLFTPGLRFHLPNHVDIAVGFDFAFDFFKNIAYDVKDEMEECKDYRINFVSERGKTASYCYQASPKYAGNLALIWNFNAEDNYKDSDGDGDGVVDKKDKCWNTQKGVMVDSIGCPLDFDKDGVPDGLDKCPNTPAGAYVNFEGCPLDCDSDGVYDGLDKCPITLPNAKVDSLGCEIVGDADNDGILDNVDKCPNTPAGAQVDSLGCEIVVPLEEPTIKDEDNDGIVDSLDKCPATRQGVRVDSTGCPIVIPFDSDFDGILDSLDKCPNTPEGVKIDSLGCPLDADKDGVADYLDKCAETPAGLPVDQNGCPKDFDKDGVFDGLDKCPNTPEGMKVDSTGCSLDEDKDGVPDGVDQCPKTPANATVDALGCPLDTDKDGVADYLDKCAYTLPGIKVNEQGCPVNKNEDLNKLKQGIKFKTNSTAFTRDSYGTLNDIAALLKKVPQANLEVQGHTDNVGSASKNQSLSEKRAKAVTDYLEKQGVEGSRLRAVGYGSEKPIASNGSKEGRKQNRRVELIPFIIEAAPAAKPAEAPTVQTAPVAQ